MNKEEEKIAEIISNFFNGSITEADCDVLAMNIYEKNIVLKVQQIADLEAKLAESEERINWLVEAEFNRKWAKKYVEMRRKEDPMLCLPDSDEVYEKYFELKQQLADKEEQLNNSEQKCLICYKEQENEQLKQQLAESENKVKKAYQEGLLQKQFDKDMEIEQLKQQLAEKEKEIEELKQRLKDTIKIYSDDFVEKDKGLKELRYIVKSKVQDKISFAVEQILDIKEEVFGTREMGIIFDIPPVQDAFNAIENKIKQLTHQQEDKGE